MMGHREEMKGGDEYDALRCRAKRRYHWRAGRRGLIKRQFNKRQRREARFHVKHREQLPNRRPCETVNMRVHDQEVIVTTGYHADGRVGEVFITSSKVGSNTEAIARDAAVVLSIAIQFGVPLTTLRGAVTREQDGSPSTVIGAVLDQLEVTL